MRLPLVDSSTVIKILQTRGYHKIGQSGSHVQFKDAKGTIITVPVHPGRKVGRGLLRKIIRDLEISREEFMELVKNA